MRQNWLLYSAITELEDSSKSIAEKIAPILLEEKIEDEDYRQLLLEKIDDITSLLGKEGASWIPIEHKISTEEKEKIEKLNIAGLGFEPEETRYYPESSSSAQLLGFVGKNEEGLDTGYFGLEGFYDIALSGKSGVVSREKDVKGVPLLGQASSEIGAVSGADLVTHINKRIQLSLEKNLKEGIERYGAKTATGIIMDPESGAIMAMGAYPSFDPVKYFDFSNELFKNPIISERDRNNPILRELYPEKFTKK